MRYRHRNRRSFRGRHRRRGRRVRSVFARRVGNRM